MRGSLEIPKISAQSPVPLHSHAHREGRETGIHSGYEDNDYRGGDCSHIGLTAFYARCVRHLCVGKATC